MDVLTITHVCCAMELYLDQPGSYGTGVMGALSSLSVSSIGVFKSTLYAPMSGITYVTTMSGIPVSGFDNITAIAETIYPYVSTL